MSMLTSQQLTDAFTDASAIMNHSFDTFAFRKYFEENFSHQAAGTQILDYVKNTISQGGTAYRKLKAEIDNQEFLSTDYYANPGDRKFLGAYAPVVYKTFAGLMAICLPI